MYHIVVGSVSHIITFANDSRFGLMDLDNRMGDGGLHLWVECGNLYLWDFLPASAYVCGVTCADVQGVFAMIIVTVVPKLNSLKSRKSYEDKTPLVLYLGSNWKFDPLNPWDKSHYSQDRKEGRPCDLSRWVHEDRNWWLQVGFSPIRSIPSLPLIRPPRLN
jgi:hypothetical protein